MGREYSSFRAPMYLTKLAFMSSSRSSILNIARHVMRLCIWTLAVEAMYWILVSDLDTLDYGLAHEKLTNSKRKNHKHGAFYIDKRQQIHDHSDTWNLGGAAWTAAKWGVEPTVLA